MRKTYHVYIITDHRNGTFYTGVTSNLILRCEQHRSGTGSDFARRYRLKHLVWYENHDDPESAIRREKRIKKWTRKQKLFAIEEINPEWRDLYFSLGGAAIAGCPKIPDPRAPLRGDGGDTDV